MEIVEKAVMDSKQLIAPRPPEPINKNNSEYFLQRAKTFGLQKHGAQPKLSSYIKDAFRRKEFIRALGENNSYSKNQGKYLGQMWALLSPTLNAIFYVIFFGLILRAGGELSNGIAFIIIGQFLWQFLKFSASTGGKSVSSKTNIVRSLHFPKVVLPLATVYSLFVKFLWSSIVMLAMVMLSGLLPSYSMIFPHYRWLLLPLVFILMFFFASGVAFIIARIVAKIPDLSNVVDFLLRFGMFASGVVFPITRFVSSGQMLYLILTYQPFAVYINLARQIIMNEALIPMTLSSWVAAIIWTVVTFTVGFIFFWRGESNYGRS